MVVYLGFSRVSNELEMNFIDGIGDVGDRGWGKVMEERNRTGKLNGAK